ncbi:MAG: bifunctional homocysteine S-methyltransferase/methylenetetrahydrofolate reductase [Clostridia bacterium]|jgi:homocysteine S-methyltransferase
MLSFREVLDKKIPLLLDGAMGTELYKRGVFINRSFEEANLSNRRLVLSIHKDYKDAGADVLKTNSWGAGYYKLKDHNLHDKVYEINLEAAKLACEVSAGELYVAGTVGPLGHRLEPFGMIGAAEAFKAFREQIQGLHDGGVDFILLETFTDLTELQQAILASKSVAPDLPIVSCLAIELSGELLMGPPLEESLASIAGWGSDVVGLNCHVGPQSMLGAIKKLKGLIDAPLIMEPNAGLPKEVDGRTLYMATPEYFAEYTKKFLQEGVRFVGGCCGTGPEHIKGMAQSMRQFRAMSQHADAGCVTVRCVDAPDLADKQEETAGQVRVPFADKSRWSAKLARGEKVYTIELVPPAGITPTRLLESAKAIKHAGIDTINIPDGPRASSRLSTIITAILVEQRVGIETILHYTCRDRNLIGMQSDMLGAHAIGLRNMLLLTGDPPKLGDYPNATGVFDVDAIGLTRMVRRLNGGIDLGGRPIGEPTALSLGVGVNPVHSDFDYEMERFRRKLEAGAEWAITQPVFDIRALERFFAYMAKHNLKLPIIVGIWPLTSLKNAQFMRNEVPGIEIPDEVMERMARTETPQEGRDEGVEIARQLCAAVISEVQGVQLSAPFGRVDLALRVIGK